MLSTSLQPSFREAPAAPEPRLVAAAHEFEAQLLKELLKPLTRSEDEEGGEGSTNALGEYASEALGTALSRQGGFGIANRLLTQIPAAASQSGNRTGSAPVTAKPHENTVPGHAE
ncbi:hypothetical protein DYQ86_01845 [Acidobacteria bacterium AB60]|nr:hypothetical protein DYQ86_01845 [Acidobacteria bacterium AB60]